MVGRFFGILITLIKRLKGHKSLGSLGSDVKGLIVSSVRRTNGPTKGQGHLLSCSVQLKMRFYNKCSAQINKLKKRNQVKNKKNSVQFQLCGS